MDNFVHEGVALDLVAPSGGVTGGVGYLFGAIFVIAARDADEDDSFAGYSEGVFDLAAETHATTQAIDQGDPVYYDATNHRCTKTATGNQIIGVAVADKASTAAIVRVKLQPRLAAGTAIADISLAAVTGVDGTGSNAASKADVDTRMTTIQNKINGIIAAMESGGTVVA